MKCGDRGHVTSAGTSCQQTIGAKAKACVWHSRTAEGRRLLALKGGIASRMQRALPADYRMLPFESREAVIRFAEEMARLALKEDVDPRRVDTALRAAGVTLSGFAAATQERLVDALVKLEHGGAAFAWFSRLEEGLQDGRPLPPRLRRALTPPEDAS